ncbi:MAG: sulfatase-like hydrolase/transferase [Chloroflexota bacterium]|nr:sulfatase-like hydrolase/transferase [Chloroflexota bacterium]
MPSGQPNILLITTDQQRFDTVGPHAPGFLRTPHFDTLAHEGITFSRAYADCPICVPSRVSIMTGKTIFNHGMAYFGDTATQ